MYFRSKVDPEEDPLCRFCREVGETFEHLVNECPRFIGERRDKFLGHIVTNDHMWSVQTLLDFSYIAGIHEALGGGLDQFLVQSSGDDTGQSTSLSGESDTE